MKRNRNNQQREFKMTKKEMIKDIHYSEKQKDFYYTEIDFIEGCVGIRKNGDFVYWGEPVHCEINGKWTKCNLNRLPKNWVKACWNSNLMGTFVEPTDTKEQARVYKEWLYFEGIIDKSGNYIN